MKYAALILAAGKGTRMHSNKPKVLQTILGEPMLGYVVRALDPIFSNAIWAVIGHQAEMVQRVFASDKVKYILQEEQRGTGHALMTAMPQLQKNKVDYVLVINGDAPMVSTETIEYFMREVKKHGNPAVGFASIILPYENDYGRVIRSQGDAVGIVEAKDYASGNNTVFREIKEEFRDEYRGEVNAGIYLLHVPTMEKLLPMLSDKNKGGELYITDLVRLSTRHGHGACGIVCHDSKENLMGVNTPEELINAEKYMRAKIVNTAIEQGVLVHFGHMVVIGADVKLAPGSEIFGPCEIYGKSIVARGAVVSSHTVLRNTIVGERAQILSFSHLEDAFVGDRVVVGPYARLRPGTKLEDFSKVGNFVEVKNSIVHKGAKVNHLSYIGDASVGESANIGAGTITCNYDGKNKFQTHIGQGAFIGSNTALVAPVKIGKNALVGAGSVITKDVPDDELGIGRTKQKNLPRKI